MEVDVLIETDGVASRRERISVDGAMSVGRASYSTLFLDGDLVSRTHALIEIVDGGLRVEDTSSNGTRAGENLLRRTSEAVPYGTPIGIGNYTLYVSPAKRRPVGKNATVPAPPPGGDWAPDVVPPAPKRPRSMPPLPISGVPDASTPERPTLDPRRSGLRAPDSHPAPSAVTPSSVPPTTAAEPSPFDELLGDPAVSRIMVIDPQTTFIERSGRRTKCPLRFNGDHEVRAAAELLLFRAGVRVRRDQRLYRAQLPDGGRIQVVLSPPATRGTCVTIDKPDGARLSREELVEAGALSVSMLKFLERCTKARKNIVVSGGAGSGKTSILRLLASAIPTDERIVLIEDAPEILLDQPHVVTLRTTDGSLGAGQELAELVRAATVMHPDRVICGDCRGAATLDMLHATTEHDGSMFCLTASSPAEAIARMEAAIRAGGYDMAKSALRELMATSLHLMVHATSFADGSRRITDVHELRGLDERGRLVLHPVYEFEQTGLSANGAVLGEHRSTGYEPSFLGELKARGLVRSGDDAL